MGDGLRGGLWMAKVTFPTFGGRGKAIMWLIWSPTMSKRKHYTQAFKEGAIKLVTDQGYTIGEAARRLGVARKSLHDWLGKLAPGFDASQARNLEEDPAAMRDELRRLRKENDRLRMEREILKKATAYFAKEST